MPAEQSCDVVLGLHAYCLRGFKLDQNLVGGEGAVGSPNTCRKPRITSRVCRAVMTNTSDCFRDPSTHLYVHTTMQYVWLQALGVSGALRLLTRSATRG
jgi:hypothetical protein